MTGEGDETRGRVVGRPWFLIGLVLAVGATIPLVVADDIRYLRLGIVAALWAALIGAFLAVRYRRQATNTEEAVAQAQEVYELELEREIAARREFELEVEAETRQRVESESRSELDALRTEIASLRDNLQSLFGGEVLLERVALTAQATRMRALHEEQRVVESGTSQPPQITAAKKREITDRPTEFIERVREKEPVRAGGRPSAPEPRRPEVSMDLPVRRVANAEPVDPERTRVQPAAKKPERPQTRPVEPSRPAPSRPDRGRPTAATTPVKREPQRVEQPTQVAKAVDPDWTPRAERSATDLSAAFPTRVTRPVQPEPSPVVPEDHPVVNETLPVEVRRLAQQGRPGGRRRRAEEDEAPAGRRRRPDEAPRVPDADEAPPGLRSDADVPASLRTPEADAGRRGAERAAEAEALPRLSVAAEAEGPARRSSAGAAVAGRRSAESTGYRSAAAISGRRSAEASGHRAADETPTGRRSAEATGHRAADEVSSGRRSAEATGHRATDETPAGRRSAEGTGHRAADETPTGRRHRPDDEAATWASTGRRAKPEPETPRGRRAAVEEDTGSHSAGRSVSELLAANGKTATPRRRRRAED
ncbi:DUF6779 domain-containing protein [Amycolatopsis thermoflava]|uniref:DUF6779 domain-containing protein n=1 Tax=Amycolatopsis thermoflava TaxID=84480 RepID=UPI00381EBBF4